MSAPVVGSASVEVTADLERFGSDVAESVKKNGASVTASIEKSLKQAGDDASTKAGADVGQKFMSHAAQGVRANAGQLTNESRRAATKAGEAAESQLGEYGKKAAEKFNDSAKETFKSLHGAVLGGVGALGVGEVVKGTIEAADQLEGANIKIEHIFGESAGAVQSWAKSLANSFGISQAAGEAAAGAYANILKPLGEGPEVTAKMSESLVTLSANLAHSNNVDQAKAQAALINGIRGRTNALKLLGITVSATDVQQEAARLGLVKTVVDTNAVTAAHGKLAIAQEKYTALMKTGKATTVQQAQAQAAVTAATQALTKAEAGKTQKLSDGAKTQAAYNLIMKQAAKNHDTGAIAASNLKQREAVLDAQFTNMKATLGNDLLPVLTKLAGFMLNDVLPALKDTGHWIVQNKEWIVPLVVALGTAVAVYKAYTLATSAWQTVSKGAQAVMALFTSTTVEATAATEGATVAQGELDAAMDANPIGLVVAALAALAAGFIYAWKHSETFRDIVKGAFHGLEVAFEAVGHAFKWVWNTLISPVFNFIKEHWGIVFAVLTGGFSLILQHWRDIWNGIKTVWNWAHDNVFTPTAQAFHLLAHIIGTILSTIKHAWSTAWNDMKDLVTGIVTDIGDIVSGIWDGITSGIKSVINGAIEIIDSVIGAINGMIDVANDIPFVNIPHISAIPQLHAKGGQLSGFDVVGDAGPELLLGGRTVVSNPTTPGGNFDEFANRIADKLGGGNGEGVRLHPDSVMAIAAAISARPAILKADKRELARTVDEGKLLLGRLG